MAEALLPLTDDRGEGACWKERTETEPLTPTKNTAATIIAITIACGTPAPSDKSAFVRLPTVPNTPAMALAGDAAEVMAMLAAGDPATVVAGADELPRQARPPPASGERRPSFGGRSGRTRQRIQTFPARGSPRSRSPRRNSLPPATADLCSLFMSSLADESDATELKQKLAEAPAAMGFSRIYSAAEATTSSAQPAFATPSPLPMRPCPNSNSAFTPRQPSPNAVHDGTLDSSPAIAERSVVFPPSHDKSLSQSPSLSSRLRAINRAAYCNYRRPTLREGVAADTFLPNTHRAMPAVHVEDDGTDNDARGGDAQSPEPPSASLEALERDSSQLRQELSRLRVATY